MSDERNGLPSFWSFSASLQLLFPCLCSSSSCLDLAPSILLEGDLPPSLVRCPCLFPSDAVRLLCPCHSPAGASTTACTLGVPRSCLYCQPAAGPPTVDSSAPVVDRKSPLPHGRRMSLLLVVDRPLPPKSPRPPCRCNPILNCLVAPEDSASSKHAAELAQARWPAGESRRWRSPAACAPSCLPPRVDVAQFFWPLLDARRG